MSSSCGPRRRALPTVRCRGRRWIVLLLAALATPALATPARAQESDPLGADAAGSRTTTTLGMAERLEAEGRLDEARRLLEGLLHEEPGSREALDRLADVVSALALAYAREGRVEDALRTLETVLVDPDAAAVREARALLALWAGRPTEAIGHLRIGVTARGADPGARTRWIAMLGTLEAADSTAAALVGRALGVLFRTPEAAKVEALFELFSGLPAGSGQPALLELAAHAFEEVGRPTDAGEIRRRLVETYPESAEAPVAMLELGREWMRRDLAAARAWLERLVVEYPESAVSPLARGLMVEIGAATGSP